VFALLSAVVTICAVASAGAAGRKLVTVAKTLSAPAGPAGLRFYTPPKTLPRGPHGTLIWERRLHGVAALRGATNYVVLYKQVGIRGRIVGVSGIVSIPMGKAPAGGWPVVTYAHGTTGIADQCAPSRDTGPKSGGDKANRSIAPLLSSWIKAGYAVLRTDYEGLGGPGPHPFLIGRSEGRGVLDIVRAARQLDPAVSKRVIISGHSQGGHAALWAASLAPSYTPELRLLGTVAFAPQSHTAAEASFLKTVNLASLTPLASLILRGVAIADPSLRVGSLLTPAAARLYPQTLSTCLNGLSLKKSFGGLPLTGLVARSANLTASLAEIAKNDPDHLKIKGPVLLEQGLADKTVLPALDRQLSQSLAAAGDAVTYTTYTGATHGSVLRVGAKQATAFLRKRFGH
jgi:pimeloyl-ACP methyl ester carboxylesterase